MLTPGIKAASDSSAGTGTDDNRVLIAAFVKIDKTALGVAFGTLLGLGIFSATVFLVWKGGASVGPNLGLLSQFFRGYSVTLVGSLVGLAYGFLFGFVLGWLTAFLRNFFVTTYLYAAKFRTAVSSLEDLIDGP